ncbi:E3 ubiquitin-protein ligase RAD18 [Alternaria panax]|uniref:Postreplication repair E3 ubiquitin-protein ligase RAD18 n=1 Tax=Alternaria panax TaxID=48097 RepID=A0AAD4IHX2_9PLEO|nr:E3 ubiquitin-protein ligase RAD18 [Alternaria panax]
MDSSFDLPDSTDWIKTCLPAFEPLEAALRCEVCKEFYNNPVITSCSHTFCSICIRRCIAVDGKCPSCKTGCSSDKLAPNIAVREVVMRFQEARPKAMELARADKEEKTSAVSKKKRKLDDTDMEDGDSVRHTRSRQTRTRSQRNGDRSRSPVVVADSEDDGDDDFMPDGMAKCPMCNKAMKAELVYNHLDVCTGPEDAQGRGTRSRRVMNSHRYQSTRLTMICFRTKSAFPPAFQLRKKDPSPPPTRLSQLNYAMLKETALRKKLQEIGIPTWGTKDLMKRRHIEWLNIYNSNCDADESVRKSKRQLLRELDEWEQTLGGKAGTKESKIMKKDFDGNGYAKSHKTEFDDLIAQARQKRGTPKTDSEGSSERNTPAREQNTESQDYHARQVDGAEVSNHRSSSNYDLSEIQPSPSNNRNSYENNEPALAIIRAKVEEVNNTSAEVPALTSK